MGILGNLFAKSQADPVSRKISSTIQPNTSIAFEDHDADGNILDQILQLLE